MAGDIMKSMANKAKESMTGSYMTDPYNKEWETSQANEGGWLNQFRAIFKDAETSDAFKEAVRGLRDQMINGKTAEERGQARAAFNDAITAWKEASPPE